MSTKNVTSKKRRSSRTRERSLQAGVLELRADNARLIENKAFWHRLVAALVEEAGGEMSVADKAIDPSRADIMASMVWVGTTTRRLVVQVTGTKLQNEKLSD